MILNCSNFMLLKNILAAYNTIDNEILLNKLSYYGIRGKSNRILRSYLSDRKKYVELDTFKSEIVNSLPCSVIQGGKLSGLLYNLYINELPLLHKLIFDKSYNNINLQKF